VFSGHDLLDPQVQPPAVGEVVVVDEPFTLAQPQRGERDLVGVIPEPDAAGVGDAVLDAVDRRQHDRRTPRPRPADRVLVQRPAVLLPGGRGQGPAEQHLGRSPLGS